MIDLVAEGGTLGIVMQLVSGGDLRRYLERAGGSLSPQLTSLLLGQIADGLSAAHTAGVVHRDLKPENVLIHNADDGTPVARITDFGVAYLAGQPAQTRCGGIVGTPQYASPEAALDLELTPAADVYALGVIAYELVCGQPPFDGDDLIEIIRLHLEKTPTRPAGIPDALWSVIASCLAKDPHARPRASALAVTLRALAGNPARLKPDRHSSKRQTVSPSWEPPPPVHTQRGRGSLALSRVVPLAITIVAMLSVGLARIVAQADDELPPTTTTTAPMPPAPPTGDRVDFSFNEMTLGQAHDGRQIRDRSGNGNDGTVQSGMAQDAPSGEITVFARGPVGDKAIKFPDPCPSPPHNCPRAIVQTADPSEIKVGDREFMYGADVLVQPAEVTPRAAIIHKGRPSQPADSVWKLQLEAAGKVSCVVISPGSGGERTATSSVSITDGGWHQIKCTRTVTIHVLTPPEAASMGRR